jgi:hypothetical protein
MSSQLQAQVTSDPLLQIAWSIVPPLAIAVQNRVFDVLDPGPRTIDEVNRETGASRRGLVAVVNLPVGDYRARSPAPHEASGNTASRVRQRMSQFTSWTEWRRRYQQGV